MRKRFLVILSAILFFQWPFLKAEETEDVETEDSSCNQVQEKDPASQLMEDLLTVNYWDVKINEKFPTTYNHLLQGGYFSMPSARMGQEGEIGVGYGYVPPYILYNARFQLADFLEVSGNYRIFKGVADPVLTHHGFGDFSDKGANLKLSLFSPEDSHYKLPGLAVGLEDFIGTRAFRASYIVMTHVFLKQGVELSLGFGTNRIRKWFGGMSWMPFFHSQTVFFKNLSLVLEYDAIPYRDETIERHPKGRKKITPLQIGFKWRFFETFDCSLAYIRGDKVAFTVSSYYNFGHSKGLFPKIHDPLPYKAPVNFEPIGLLRPLDVMVEELAFAFQNQGFELLTAYLCDNCGKKDLKLYVTNFVYRDEFHMRTRLNALLASLVPKGIDHIVVVIDSVGLPVQELHYSTIYLQAFHEGSIGRYELDTLTPLKEVTVPCIYTSKLIYKKGLEWWNFEILPKVKTLFGSASGKFKYALGVSTNVNGFLFDDVYYSVGLGYYFFSHLNKVHNIDRLNPSQIINVRTDIVEYYQQKGVSVDEAYLEKMWNCGKGWYTRLSLGLLETEYGGVGAEWLYYPVNSLWAVGMDCAVLKKRLPHGVDFTSYVRKLHGFQPHWRKFIGTQCFLNLYYDWKATSLSLKTSVGKFLANDVGIRTEVSRYFENGLQMGFWYTYTNANDRINNAVYHDKGVFITVPLDIFYTHTSRSRWGYGMSAWLRDVGVSAVTGNHLYETLYQERQ